MILHFTFHSLVAKTLVNGTNSQWNSYLPKSSYYAQFVEYCTRLKLFIDLAYKIWKLFISVTLILLLLVYLANFEEIEREKSRERERERERERSRERERDREREREIKP